MEGALRTWFRSKSTLFWTLAFPILLMLLFGAIFSVNTDPRFEFYIQNNDLANGSPTTMSTTLINMLNDTGVLNIKTIDASMNLDTYIEKEGVELLLVIPEDSNRVALPKTQALY
jgi:ABC-2 type transport system permease protein